MHPGAPTVVCWGELVVDLSPDGAFLGGTAANVARHAATLGARARLVSATGDDAAGAAALGALARLGVDLEHVLCAPGATATVHVGVRDGQPCYRAGARLPWQTLDFSAPLAGALAGADALVFALFAQGTCLDVELLARVTAPRLRVCDLNLRRDVPRALLERVAELAHVIQLDATAAERVGRILQTPDPARALLELGSVELVAVTNGARGARLVRRGAERVSRPPRIAHTAHAVGAGDAFAAAMTLALLARASSEDVLARALEHALAHVESVPEPLRIASVQS